MQDASSHQVTHLLLDLKNGNLQAFDQLTPLVYNELRKIASRYLRQERKGHTIQTTDLVHETYLRLIDEAHFSWENRAHFFAVAARAMRQLLVENARKRKAKKRGGGAVNLSLDEGAVMAEQKSDEILALEEALQTLEKLDERMTRIVELRYFSGLTIEETAAVLSISPATVKREWNTARAWLAKEMRF